jgi:hypothetical protein
MAATKNTDTAADEIPRGFNLIAAHLVNIKVVLESISDQMEERNNLLRGSSEASDERAPVATIADADVLARLDALEGAMSSIPGKMDDLTVLVKSIATMVKAPAVDGAGRTIEPTNGAAKAIAGRIIEHTIAQVQAGTEAAPTKRGRGRPPKPENCKHETTETLESGLRRCTRCGAVLEATVAGPNTVVAVIDEVPALKESGALAAAEKVAIEKVAAVKEKLAERIAADERSFKAPVEATEKKPAPKESVYKSIDGKLVEVDPETLQPLVQPASGVDKNEVEAVAHMEAQAQQPEPVKATLDDVRAVAIGYAGKHGKEKLGAVLVKYGAGNLSSVPAEKYDALMAELQAS